MHHTRHHQELLTEKIINLPFSFDFKMTSHAMGLERLQDIVAMKEPTLMANRSFNHNWFKELVDFFIQHEMIELLEAKERF